MGGSLGLGKEKREQVDGSTIQNIAYQHAPNWEWQGDDGIYVPYDSSVAMMLEKAHSKLDATNSGHCVAVGSATVDVRAMEHRSSTKGSPELRRPVRRKTRDEVKRGLAEPSWVHQEQEVMMADVDAEHTEAELVRGILFGEGGLNTQQWGIVSIQRVQNQPLREAYCIEKQLIRRERGDDQVNEQLLLHGTRTSDPVAIIEDRDGFMVEKGSERAFYGQGCYFAELAQYSHLYSYAANGNHQLLLADVLCGNVYEMGDELDRTGVRCNRAWLRSNSYDSVAGGPHTPLQRGPGNNQSRLHVVYRANQTYPRFLVTYKAIAPMKDLGIAPSVRVPCRKRTNPKSSVIPRTVQRFSPTDVKVSHHEQILAIALVEDSLCLATATAVHLDCHGDASRVELQHTAHHAAWSDAGQLALAQKNRRLLLVNDAKDLPKTSVEHPSLIQCLCWCGEDQLATGSKDYKVRVFTESRWQETYAHSSPVLSMAWCNGKLAVGGSDGKLCLLSTTGSLTPERTVDFRNWLTSLAWSMNGETLAAGCDDGKVYILRGTEERAIAHEDRVCSLKFHPELGHIVASGAINGKIRIVNTMSGSAECVARSEEVVTSATWNAAGDALAVGCDGGTLRVFLFQPKMSLMERLERQSFHSFGSERSQKVLPGANVLVLLCRHMYRCLGS